MPGFDTFFHQDLTPFHAVPTPFAADPTINYANLKILLQFRFLDPLLGSVPRLNNAWIQPFFFRIRTLFLRIRHFRIHQSFLRIQKPIYNLGVWIRTSISSRVRHFRIQHSSLPNPATFWAQQFISCGSGNLFFSRIRILKK